MANPQKEQGHLRIANEIWDQIMMCDFNREKRAILDLVLRLSWGCGKKSALIPRQKDFCLAGIPESNVKKNLKWLEKAKVLLIDWDSKLYMFNKDYDSWRVSLVDNYDEERLNLLIYQNIQLSNNKEKLSNSEEILLNNEDFLSNSEESKPVIPCGTKDEDTPKNRYTDIQINNKEEEEERASQNPFSFFEANGFGVLSPTMSESISQWIDSSEFDEPEEIIIFAMREALLNNARSWKYVNKILVDWSNRKLKTIRDVKAYQAEWEANKQQRQNVVPLSKKQEKRIPRGFQSLIDYANEGDENEQAGSQPFSVNSFG